MAARRATRTGQAPSQPSRLSTRLARSIVLTGIVVFVSIALVVASLLSSHMRRIAREDSVAALSRVQSCLAIQTRGVETLAEMLAANPDREPAGPEGESYERLACDADKMATIVWVDADGTARTASAGGDSEDLIALAGAHPQGASGLAVLASGPAVVSILPFEGHGDRSAGVLAVARPALFDLGENELQQVAVTATDDARVPDDWRMLEAPEGYASVGTDISNGMLVTRGVLADVSGVPALTVELSRPDPWLGEGRIWLIGPLVIVLGVFTIGAGYALAVGIGRSIERPLHGFVDYLQDQGYLALQGLRTDEELLIAPDLPQDFAKLGHVITDLMTQLRINQSEIIEAGDQALAAEMAFRTVVEESPEVKILVRGGVVEIANPAAAHFFGLQLGDLLRAEPDGLFSGIQLLDENDRRLELLRIARDAHDTPVVARCVTHDQPDRWIELSVAFIDYEGDDYVISARNVTEERRLEALRAEVLSLVSHDLRSPLTVVRGYIDILERPLEDDRRTSAVESARKAALRMEGLLDDLLHATKAEVVFAPRVMRPVDLSALVDGIASSLAMGALQDVATSLEPGVTVLGDPVRLEQAIANLIGNALKHGPDEGQVRVGVHTSDGKVIVSVEDDGPGIPEDQRERVFERGARATAAEGTPGLGLGLYIVRVVAEAHGGVVFVDPEATGTRFVLELPVVLPETED